MYLKHTKEQKEQNDLCCMDKWTSSLLNSIMSKNIYLYKYKTSLQYFEKFKAFGFIKSLEGRVYSYLFHTLFLINYFVSLILSNLYFLVKFVFILCFVSHLFSSLCLFCKLHPEPCTYNKSTLQ